MTSEQTIARTAGCSGVGLHSDASVSLQLFPAPAGTGVVFVRDGVEIPARHEFISSAVNATTLSNGGVSVATVEHLLAALSCLGVDNVRLEIDGPEVPVMDGSAAPFVELLQSAGTRTQSVSRAVLRVTAPVSYQDGARSIRIEPADALRISYAIDFEHPAIGRQEIEILDLAAFEKELAPARTFGFLRDLDALRAAGLAGGASLENTVVLDDTAVLNPGGLRWPDEFVRHKVLDLLGDLALLGRPILGHIHVERGGHSLHHALVAALRQSR